MGCAESTPQLVDIPSGEDAEANEAAEVIDDVQEAAELLNPSNALSSQVELIISCANLIELDQDSKSDPFVVFYEKKLDGWVEIGRTEVLIDNTNPQFTHHFPFTYRFEENQIIKFDVFDADGVVSDSTHLDLAKQDFIGSAEVLFANVIASRCCQVTMPLVKGKDSKRGLINIKAEEMSNQNAVVELQFTLRDCTLKDGFYYFIQVFRYSKMGDDACYRTEVVKKEDNNLEFSDFTINIQPLCNGDNFRPLNFRIMRWGKNGAHVISAICQTCLNDMQNNSPLIPLKNKENSTVGYLKIEKCNIVPKPTFLEYIRGGCEMNFMVAIDFAATNGDPSQPTSLHYIDPEGTLNQYERAIYSVGSVLEFYDNDRLFPVYGFGGVVDGKPNHCFPLNFNNNNPEVEGTAGILSIYRESITKIGLYSQSLFSRIVGEASKLAKTYKPGEKYLVLLIITDGVINDMGVTVSKIISASSLPMSILIVGVGEADFSNMEQLDGDKNPLVSESGEKPARPDIVQFVPMKDFIDKDPLALTKALLEELPSQFLQYMKLHNISPSPPPVIPPPPANYIGETVPPPGN